MVRSIAIVLLVALATVLPAAGAAAATTPPAAAWDTHEQRVVAAAGVLPVLIDGDFHGERPLSGGQLRGAMNALAVARGAAPVTIRTDETPTVFSFDRVLVKQVGLGDVAAAVRDEAARAGLAPLQSFGSEVVARLAGLRHDQPSASDALERYPWEPITRAEAAWSLAQVIGWAGSQEQWIRDTLSGFVLPSYTAPELRVLRAAVAKVGMPYVWGGETDGVSYGQAHGGYDCSGFVWRVFKYTGNPVGRRIRGRVAADQAGEIARAARLRLAQVRPADLLFFGPGRFDQRATYARVTHEGIALSPAFMINSAATYGGVSVSPLIADDHRHRHFSWARRVL